MPSFRRVQLPTALLFVALSLVALHAWVSARRAASTVLAAETHTVGTQIAARLSACTDTRVVLLEAMAREWEAGGLRDDLSFRARATSLIDSFPGYHAINLIDADGVIRRVHPQRGNEVALGLDLRAHPYASVGDLLDRARWSGGVQLSPSIDLVQGGRGIVSYVPLVDAHGAPAGWLNGVFRADELVASCIGPTDHFVAAVRDDRGLLYRSGAANAGPWTRFDVVTRDRRLELRIAPDAEGLEEHRGPGLGVLALGLLCCAVVSLLYERDLRARAERAALAAELGRARRLSAIGRLAAGVAHDFNNLLTVLQFGAESLRFARDERTRTARLDEMDRAITRAVGLTAQMLTLGRRRAAELQPTSVAAVVLEMERLLRRVLPEKVTLEVLADDPLGTMVYGDPVRIERIVLNLVTNAGDAYDGPGTVRVEVRRVGGGVVLRVSDSGRGMDAATLRHMYEPFFTTRLGAGGTGVGLATVHDHVQAMDATIEVDSAPRAGTRVLVSWAALEPSEVRHDTPELAPRARRVAAGVRVLVAEDGDLVRNVARTALRGAGYDVVEARDGFEAIERLADDPSVAVVVTDAVMPRASGGEIIEWAAIHRPDLPVVVVSGYADEAVSEAAARRSSVSFLAKPYAPGALLDAVAAALSRVPAAG